VEEGGETAFSKSAWLNETAQRTAQPSECAAAKVFVKPRKGDALLFWDLKPDGQTGLAAKLPPVCHVCVLFDEPDGQTGGARGLWSQVGVLTDCQESLPAGIGSPRPVYQL